MGVPLPAPLDSQYTHICRMKTGSLMRATSPRAGRLTGRLTEEAQTTIETNERTVGRRWRRLRMFYRAGADTPEPPDRGPTGKNGPIEV